MNKYLLLLLIFSFTGFGCPPNANDKPTVSWRPVPRGDNPRVGLKRKSSFKPKHETFSSGYFSSSDWGNSKYTSIPQKDIVYFGGQKLDLFRPKEMEGKLPLVIFLHSGGFFSGSKENPIINRYANDFARAGFATASVGYSKMQLDNLGGIFNLFFRNKEHVRTSIYKSLKDLNQAIQFLENNSDKFQIDTDNIFLAGFSAGGIIAMNYAYLDDVDAKSYFGRRDYNCFKCGYEPQIKGVIGMGGAILDVTDIDDNDDIPLLLMHGSDDAIVDLKQDYPFNKYIKDYELTLPGLYYEVGIQLTEEDKTTELTIGGVNASAQSPKWISEFLQAIYTFKLSGSKAIYNKMQEGVLKDICRFVEFENAPHCFMRNDKNEFGKEYNKSREEIYNFIQHFKN